MMVCWEWFALNLPSVAKSCDRSQTALSIKQCFAPMQFTKPKRTMAFVRFAHRLDSWNNPLQNAVRTKRSELFQICQHSSLQYVQKLEICLAARVARSIVWHFHGQQATSVNCSVSKFVQTLCITEFEQQARQIAAFEILQYSVHSLSGSQQERHLAAR